MADLTGGVFEWTLSAFDDGEGRVFGYPYDPEDGRERTDGTSLVQRVTRGGAFQNDRSLAQAADRHFYLPDHCGQNFGMRLVRDG